MQQKPKAVALMIVIKFGGSSVSTISRMRRVAERVSTQYLSAGQQVVIVVSAMQGETDRLSQYLKEFPRILASERDLVLSSGEPVATALLALAFQERGISARAFCGWQLPIVTDGILSNARILNIATGQLDNCLSTQTVPIVAGFQGITEDSRITTLGRGGSDTTAVALAAALQAERCDIYTDVDGVYTADPRLLPSALKRRVLSYEEMFEMAFRGAKVLQARSVELAMKYKVPVRVLSSFSAESGTLITEDPSMEHFSLTAIAHQSDLVHCILDCAPEYSVLDLLQCCCSLNIPLEWLEQRPSPAGGCLTFLVSTAHFEQVKELCQNAQEAGQLAHYTFDADIAKISVVGTGIGTRPAILHTVVGALRDATIAVQAVSVSPMSIGLLIGKQDLALAVPTLHAAFDWTH